MRWVEEERGGEKKEIPASCMPECFENGRENEGKTREKPANLLNG